ncbi:hypothetical protein ACWDA7_19330 [Streptomyces sp. NPDC001156]
MAGAALLRQAEGRVRRSEQEAISMIKGRPGEGWTCGTAYRGLATARDAPWLHKPAGCAEVVGTPGCWTVGAAEEADPYCVRNTGVRCWAGRRPPWRGGSGRQR